MSYNVIHTCIDTYVHSYIHIHTHPPPPPPHTHPPTHATDKQLIETGSLMKPHTV